MQKKKQNSGDLAGLDATDLEVIRLIKHITKMSKKEAPDYGMKESTFQVHAKKLTRMGILVEETVKVLDGKGRPRVLYGIRDKHDHKKT